MASRSCTLCSTSAKLTSSPLSFNSSSVIREGAYLGIPGVNIGNRQRNREKGQNIINVKNNGKEIYSAIKRQLKKKKRYKKEKIFGDGKTANRIVKILLKTKIDINKTLNY